MRIRWENIIPPILIILVIVLFIQLLAFLPILLEKMSDAPRYEPEPFHRLVALGMLCIVVVAVCKIIFNRRR